MSNNNSGKSSRHDLHGNATTGQRNDFITIGGELSVGYLPTDVNSASRDQVIQKFTNYRTELDAGHDRYERLVKLSRDVTIESKRIIFLLHRVAAVTRTTSADDHSADTKTVVFDQAAERLKKLREDKFKAMARELEGQDQYHYLRAVSPGMQEYIEAVSLLHYLQFDALIPVDLIRKSLQFSVQPADQPHVDGQSSVVDRQRQVAVNVPTVEYILGIGDLTGELMRLAMTFISSGDLEAPRRICSFLSKVHGGFLSFGNHVQSKEFGFKMKVLKDNLVKVEKTCYLLQLRSTEVPKHLLAGVIQSCSFAAEGERAGER